MSDPVKAPSHYIAGEFECIDVMRAVFTPEEFRAHCLCTAFAYLWRHGRKEGEPIERDVAKAARYLEWAREVEVPDQAGVTAEAMAEAAATRDAAVREMNDWRQRAIDQKKALVKAEATAKGHHMQIARLCEERDRWKTTATYHYELIIKLQAKIDELTAKAAPT